VTKIDYGLPIASHVRLSVFDLLGREVATLINGLEKPGYRSVSWNGMDHSGKTVGAGMYFYVIQAEGFRQVRKMVLLK
jgi:flagellar hook assembly protein FlgD